jgi:hypothetical protein
MQHSTDVSPDSDLELDWLCEPEWNNYELELFWSVIRPHLEHLLEQKSEEDPGCLPCTTVAKADCSDPKMFDR